VKTLLAAKADSENACSEARDVVRNQLAEIRTKRRELAKLEAALQMMVERCDESCGGGALQPCTIFEDIAKPAV
jgi:MerR, DNA binding